MFATSKALTRGLLDRRGRIWLQLGLVGLLVYQGLHLHLHQRLYFWLQSAWSPVPAAGLHLSQYHVAVEALPVTGVADNLSGLSYDDDRQQLWAVINNPAELLAMSPRGEVLARYPLHGFQDVEAVAYLGDDQLALADERRMELIPVPVPTRPGALERTDYQALPLGLGKPDGKNTGFEGLAYDRAGDRLFVVKEKAPRKLYEIRNVQASLRGTRALQVIDRDAWIRGKSFVNDLSAVEFDPRSGHLLLLSDESRLMLELDRDGKLVDYDSLWHNFTGLQQSVPQPEGVTFDGRGNLYLVSEPNLFYAYRREGASAGQ